MKWSAPRRKEVSLTVLSPWRSHLFRRDALQHFLQSEKTDLNVLVGALSEPKRLQLKRFKTNVDVLSTTEKNLLMIYLMDDLRSWG